MSRALGRRQAKRLGHERQDRRIDEAADPYPHGEGDETSECDRERTAGQGLWGDVPRGVDVSAGRLEFPAHLRFPQSSAIRFAAEPAAEINARAMSRAGSPLGQARRPGAVRGFVVAARLQPGRRRPSAALCTVPGIGPSGAWAWLDAGVASPVAGSRAKPCARRVRRTPGASAGGVERRLVRTVAFEHPEALDHGPHRVAVTLRGQRQRLGGARAAMPAGPSEAGHQVEGAAVGVSLHQRPYGGGAANGHVDRSSVAHGIHPGFASSGWDTTGTGGRSPGNAGVPPALTMVGLRRVVHLRPPAGAGGTPALRGALRAGFRSIAEMPAPPRF